MPARIRLADLSPGYFWAFDPAGNVMGIIRVARVGEERSLVIIDFHGATTHVDHTPYTACTFSGPLEP